MSLCPICNAHPLQEIYDNEAKARGYRCSNQLCMYNFADQECPKCGKPAVKAERPMLSLYHVHCAEGHKWAITGDDKVTPIA